MGRMIQAVIVALLILLSGCGSSSDDNNKTSQVSDSSNIDNTPNHQSDDNKTKDNTDILPDDNNKTSQVSDNIHKYAKDDIKRVIEDAEGNISKWELVYNDDETKKPKIENQFDEDIKSKVIFFDGHQKCAFAYKNKESSRNLGTKSRIVSWKMKTQEIFTVRIHIDTEKGERYLEYYPKDTGGGVVLYDNKKRIKHGIGSSATDGKWHTVVRDLQIDLQRYEIDNKFKSIKEIGIKGKVWIDDIVLLHDDGNLKIDKPVVVPEGGVVLTFDDSLIENWNKQMQYFEEEDVRVTFFCHRWGSSDKGDITPEEESMLKQFEADGHEIGYHTVDHLGTKDTKFDRYATIQQKAQAYFDDQIKPGVENMKNRGFNPVSFSYPYITGQPTHNKIIREILPHIREFFAHVYVIDEIGGGAKRLEDIKSYLDKFKADQEIGVLLGHRIDGDGEYNTPKEKLKAIISYAKEIGLRFYTLEEAHNIYLNQ